MKLKEISLAKLEKCSREQLEAMVSDELKSFDDATLREIIVKMRTEAIKIQQAKTMKMETCLKLLSVIKSKDADMLEKQKAYDDVMRFLKTGKKVLDVTFLKESRVLLDFVAGKKEVEAIDAADMDFVLKRRAKIEEDVSSQRYMSGNLKQASYLDSLLKLDAKLGLDEEAKKHIESAIKAEYGDMIRQKGKSAEYYYLTASAYREMYTKFKEEFSQDLEASV